MDKWRFKMLQNEVQCDMRRQFRQAKHQLRFSRPDEVDRVILFERLERFAPAK
ncbi:hypothetical protein [Cohnella cholangitidis]|uniref:hypothetical protein n=1 Tax=Cohnella cholangitidis TaxID=2598458 RepID=UPI0015FDEDE2|nr:hypothetical protein [Cohnella cholangitidis]